jgi:hypothetical protein
MKYVIAAAALSILQLSSGAAALAQSPACSGMTVGKLASLNGFVPFPSDNPWNRDVSNAPVDENSANIINYIGANVTLHPDFGSGDYDGHSIGIPYQIVAGSQSKVVVKFTAYGGESDPGPMPVPANTLIEGYPPRVTAIVMCWSSTRTAAGSTSSTIRFL